MARLADLKLRYRIFLHAYPYRHIDWRPGTFLQRPLREASVAVVTTAGFYLPGQQPFEEALRGGDTSYREIPGDAALSWLKIGHKSDAFDHTGIEADKNLALPLERLQELASAGVLGRLAPRQFSFMGSITAPAQLINTTAPEVARKLMDDGVDVVLLTPV